MDKSVFVDHGEIHLNNWPFNNWANVPRQRCGSLTSPSKLPKQQVGQAGQARQYLPAWVALPFFSGWHCSPSGLLWLWGQSGVYKLLILWQGCLPGNTGSDLPIWPGIPVFSATITLIFLSQDNHSFFSFPFSSFCHLNIFPIHLLFLGHQHSDANLNSIQNLLGHQIFL